MKTPLRDRVEEMLEAEYPDTLTNFQLAWELGAPEASVRRATRELTESARIVEMGGGYGNVPVRYAAVEPILPTSQGTAASA